VKTRLRHFRTRRGLTQGDLARRLGTTAATISRLETADMTVSTDWLEKFASALDVAVSDLIATPDEGAVLLAGLLAPDGGVSPPAPGETSLTLDVAVREPVALRIAGTFGPYLSGDLLVGSKHAAGEAAQFAGRDCILSAGGTVRFGKLVSIGKEDSLVLVPIAGAEAVRLDGIDWLAPVALMIRRFD
jgi:transcriptional regulator with XRE-family HTH domain